MKKLTLFLLLTCLSIIGYSQSYEQLWKQADSLISIKNYRESADIISKIRNKAIAESNSPEKIRTFFAIHHTLKTNTNYIEALHKIDENFEKNIKEAKGIEKNILENFYANFLLSNIDLQRIDENNFMSDSITIRIKKIDSLYKNSLNNKNILVKEPLIKWKTLLNNTQDAKLTPTLYHLLAYNYMDFLRVDPTKTQEIEALTVQIKAINTSLNNPQATVYLTYRPYINNYRGNIDTLRKITQTTSTNLNAHIYYLIALQSNNKDAIELLKQAKSKYPNSPWIANVDTLYEDLTRVQLSSSLPAFVPSNEYTPIQIKHKNANKLFIRVYDISTKTKQILDQDVKRNESSHHIETSAPLVYEEQVELKHFEDPYLHQTIYKINPLPYGRYEVLVSNNPDFKDDAIYLETIALDIYVSDIFISSYKNIKTNQNKNNINTISLINRKTGKPLSNKSFQFFETNNNKLKKTKQAKTNTAGELKFVHDDNYHETLKNSWLYLPDEKQWIDLDVLDNITSYSEMEQTKRHEPTDKAVIMTDRAIYRPGQPLYFKTILFTDNHNLTGKISADQAILVLLKDANQQVVDSITLITNTFGSINGKFKIPSTTLNGSFRIEVLKDKSQLQSQYIQVEEYKRPTFRVEFEQNKNTYTKSDTAIFIGKVESLNGAPLSNSTVKYEIRTSNWDRPNQQHQNQKIDSTTITDNKGNFYIKVILSDSIYKDVKNLNIHIEAEVKNPSEEIQKAKMYYRYAEQPKRLSVSISGKLEEYKWNHINVITTNSNDHPLAFDGHINIYKYEKHTLPLPRNHFSFQTEYSILDTAAYLEYFPTYFDKALSRKDRRKTLVASYPFDTNQSSIVYIDSSKFSYGEYLVEAVSFISIKDTLRETQRVNVYNRVTGKYNENTFLSYSLDKNLYQVNDTIKLTFYSDLKDANNLFIYHINGSNIAPAKVIPFDNQTATYEFVVDKSTNYPSTKIEAILIKDNKIEKQSIYIPIEIKQADAIKIVTKTFRDKITPGLKETWSFTLSQQKDTAEILASMYDSSLDQFRLNYFSPSFTLNFPYQRIHNLNHITSEFANKANSYTFLNYQRKSQRPLIIPQINNYGLWKNYIFPYHHLLPLSGTSTLEEGVVMGYQPRAKQTMTGSSVALHAKDIQDVPAANVMELLQGRVAGINIEGSASGTMPGFENTKTVIRGVSSVAVLTEDRNLPFPGICIVDGEVNTNFSLSSIPPDQIRLIEVLKDSEAVALYGTKGARGAIIIITKSGKYSIDDIKEEARLQQEKENRLNNVTARADLKETAFFYPELYTDEEGNVSFEFDSPEALTKWKLLLFAHTKDLQSGNATYFTQTQKQLMVQPNLPRFMRVGDQIVLKELVHNLSDGAVKGVAKLQFIDPKTNTLINNIIPSEIENIDFNIDAKNNSTVSWLVNVPEGYPTIIIKVLAATDAFSDGEQHELVIIPNDVLISETQKIVIAKDEKNEFAINSLNKNNLQAQLIVQSNPILEIISSLEYLKNYPYECAEQTASKWFGVKMVQYLQKHYPAVSDYFITLDSTNTSSSLRDKMSTNELSLEEMPWLRNVLNEDEKMKQLASLFNKDNIQADLKVLEERLNKLQNKDGSFVWFDGGKPNIDISIRLLEIFGKVHHLDKDLITKDNQKMISKLKSFLDQESLFSASTPYSQIIDFAYANQYWNTDVVNNKEQTAWIAKTLKHSPLSSAKKAAGIAAKSWVVANKYGLKSEAHAIFNRLDQEYVLDSIAGMYWKSNSDYYNAVSLQTYLIEAYKVLKPQHLTAMADWLFYNKTHNNWRTTWMSVDAIYALLVVNNPADFDIENKVSVWVENNPTEPNRSGIGQVSLQFNTEDLEMNKQIKIENHNNRKIYGSLVHQYFLPLEQIKVSTKDISVKKHILVFRNNEWISTKHIKSGEKVKIRLEVISNKNLNFVHLKDNRAAGFEPEYRPSGYQWGRGAYYFTNKDASTNYFIDYLPKGTHIFEHEVKTNNIGTFNSGISQIECMYDPAIHARSENLKIEIKE